jgi:hypothetical protein
VATAELRRPDADNEVTPFSVPRISPVSVRPRRLARLTLAGLSVVTAALTTLTVAAAPEALATTYGAFGCSSSTGSVTAAEQLMEGWVVERGYPKVYIGTGAINWSMDPFHTTAWRRPFLSLDWLFNLTNTYRRYPTHPEWLARARAIVDDFAAHHPVNGGPWAADVWNAMYTGIRAQQVACLQELSGRSVPSLVTYGRWLSDPSRDPGDNNQGLSYALGLLAAGCDSQNSTWVNAASNRLSQLVTTAVDGEGAVREQSPGYGVNDATLLVSTQGHLRSCVGAAPSAIDSRLANLLTFLAWSTGPRGLLTQLGDTTAAPPPVPPHFPFAAGTASEYAATRGAAGTAPDSTYAVYRGGYVFGRSTWDPFTAATYYSLRFGPARVDHGHNDHQQLTLTAFGHDLLVDSGFNGYSPADYREFLRGPTAHNVVTLPGVAFNPSAATTLTPGPAAATWQSWTVADTAYGGKTRARSVLVDTAHALAVVRDTASRATVGPITQLWHLPIGTHAVAGWNGNALATTADGRVSVHFIQLPFAGRAVPRDSASVVVGRTSPYQGWVSTGLGKKAKAPVVIMRRDVRTAHMLTVIVATPPDTTVTAALVGTTLTVRIGGVPVVVTVPSSAALSMTP